MGVRFCPKEITYNKSRFFKVKENLKQHLVLVRLVHRTPPLTLRNIHIKFSIQCAKNVCAITHKIGILVWV